MVVVTLEHKKLGSVFVDTVDSEHRAFIDIKDAEKWLSDNNFIYGQRHFFRYENPDYKEWYHVKDASWEYIDVNVEYFDDPEKESCYKSFDPGIAPWARSIYEEAKREGFVKAMFDKKLSREIMVEKFMENFGDSRNDAEYWIDQHEEDRK